NLSAAGLSLLSTTGTVTIGRVGASTGTMTVGSIGSIALGGLGWTGLSLVGASSAVQFNLTGVTTLTLPNNAVFNTTIGTGTITNPGASTADVTIGGATGT